MLFLVSKIKKLKNSDFPILRFWPGTGSYIYYCIANDNNVKSFKLKTTLLENSKTDEANGNLRMQQLMCY